MLVRACRLLRCNVLCKRDLRLIVARAALSCCLSIRPCSCKKLRRSSAEGEGWPRKHEASRAPEHFPPASSNTHNDQKIVPAPVSLDMRGMPQGGGEQSLCPHVNTAEQVSQAPRATIVSMPKEKGQHQHPKPHKVDEGRPQVHSVPEAHWMYMCISERSAEMRGSWGPIR